MKRTFKTTKVQGYFDVRIYNAMKPREQWLLKGDNDSISFVISQTNDLTFAGNNIKEYTDKQGNARQLVRVKISTNCRFYNENKEQVKRPPVSELDGKRFECYINGTDLGKESGAMKANGLWANAIMFKEVQIDDFKDTAFDTDFTQQQTQQPQQQEYTGNLPF